MFTFLCGFDFKDDKGKATISKKTIVPGHEVGLKDR